MSEVENTTPFSAIYDNFLTRVTSEMYMEMTENDTYQMLQDLLIVSIPRFEFPRFNIFDYELGKLNLVNEAIENSEGIIVQPAIYEWVGGCFHSKLTNEEINILALSMMVEWFTQQLATTENTKLKYTGSDYKMSSQANHLAKLKNMMEAYKTECFHLQRLYKRRKMVGGEMRSTAGLIMTTPNYGYNID